MEVGKLLNFSEPPSPYLERRAKGWAGVLDILLAAGLAHIWCPSKEHYFVQMKCDNAAPQGAGRVGKTPRRAELKVLV